MRDYFIQNNYRYTSEVLASAVSKLTKYSWFAKGDLKGDHHPVFDFLVSDRFLLVDIHSRNPEQQGACGTMIYQSAPHHDKTVRRFLHQWAEMAHDNCDLFHILRQGGYNPASEWVADALSLIHESIKAEGGYRSAKKGKDRHEKFHSAAEYQSETKDRISGDRFESPVYATASLHAISGMTKLFGSSIRHQHFIELRISKCSRYASNGQSRHGSNSREIISVKMSYDQFARFVASMGRGEGTPCTIGWFGALLDEPDYVNPVTTSRGQFKDRLGDKLAAARGLANKLKGMAEAPTVKKGDVKECAGAADVVAVGLENDLEFYLDQFIETMEGVVTQAQTEVETFARLNGVIRPEILALGAEGQTLIEVGEEIGECESCDHYKGGVGSPECAGCGHNEKGDTE